MEHTILFNESEGKILLQAAKESIQNGLTHGVPAEVKISEYPENLQQKLASFVTLHERGQLRGCIGTLEAHLPIIADVVKNAYLSAFKDPRFPPINMHEVPEINIEISILSSPEPISFVSEEDLIKQLRPGTDGLILSDKGRRGTFLPTVWDQLPEAQMFLDHLKAKAGLPTGYWSDTIKVERYITQLIS